MIVFSILFYSFLSCYLFLTINIFIRKFKDQKEYKDYIKTCKIIDDFITNDVYKNLGDSEKVKVTYEYFELVSRRLSANPDYKKINHDSKELFKNIIPEFKAIFREEKLKKLLE